MMADGISALGQGDAIDTKDIAELVAAAMVRSDAARSVASQA